MGGVNTKTRKKKKKISPEGQGKLHTLSQPYISFQEMTDDLSTSLIEIGFKLKKREGSIFNDDLLNLIFSYPKSISYLGNIGRVCQRWYLLSCVNTLWEPFISSLNDLNINNNMLNQKAARVGETKRRVRDLFIQSNMYIPTSYQFINQLKLGYSLPSHDKSQYSRNLLRTVIIGTGGVGKSAIVSQFVRNCFFLEYDPYFDDGDRKQIKIHDHTLIFEILDTAAMEEYQAMRDQYYRTGDCFVLIYSITDRYSFDEIKGFKSEILRVKERNYFPMILVGNKRDLGNCMQDLSDDNERKVSFQEGLELSQTLGIPFIESSAKERVNIDILFLISAELTYLDSTHAGEDAYKL
jgi:GTPase KRas protein